MTNWRIFVVAVAFMIVWMVGKYLIKRSKERRGESTSTTTTDDVERWYGNAQDRLAAMEGEEAREREGEWDGLDRMQRVTLSDQFMRRRFGDRLTDGYTNDEKLKLGRAYFIGGDGPEG